MNTDQRMMKVEVVDPAGPDWMKCVFLGGVSCGNLHIIGERKKEKGNYGNMRLSLVISLRCLSVVMDSFFLETHSSHLRHFVSLSLFQHYHLLGEGFV